MSSDSALPSASNHARSTTNLAEAQQAKDEGNKHYAKGEYHDAIEYYSKAIELLDPSDILLTERSVSDSTDEKDKNESIEKDTNSQTPLNNQPTTSTPDTLPQQGDINKENNNSSDDKPFEEANIHLPEKKVEVRDRIPSEYHSQCVSIYLFLFDQSNELLSIIIISRTNSLLYYGHY